MKTFAIALFVGSSLVGLMGCGDATVNKTTQINTEKRIDPDGHEKTIIETKTIEVDERNKDASKSTR